MLQADVQVKLPYYPGILAISKETSSGVQEINIPDIYNKPLPNGKVIVRVDLLEALRDIFGDSAFIYRDCVYKVIAYNDNLNDLFASYYRRFPTFRAYVNEVYAFGDNSVPIIDRVVNPLREKVKENGVSVYETLYNMGGKYLLRTHEYLYFAFNTKPNVNCIKGAVCIC